MLQMRGGVSVCEGERGERSSFQIREGGAEFVRGVREQTSRMEHCQPVEYVCRRADIQSSLRRRAQTEGTGSKSKQIVLGPQIAPWRLPTHSDDDIEISISLRFRTFVM